MKKLIVIGNGMVGYKFCEKAVAKSLNEKYEIIVFGEEPYQAYDRVHLSEYFTGSTVEDLQMAPRSWYEENKINLVTSTTITGVNHKEKTITNHKGETIAYDKLVFATGSSAFVPPVKGVEKDGIFVYRNIEDLDQTIEYAKKCKTGVVIGGGLLGLEAAKALKDLNLETHVVEFAPRLMPRQLDAKGAAALKTTIESLGVKIHLSKVTEHFLGETRVKALKFGDGDILSTDLVVISAGIRPRDELARVSGIEIGKRGGIVVNDKMEASVPDVYAIGEVALYENMIYGLVAPGYDMAETVVEQLCECEKEFHGFDMSTKLKLIGVDVASFGDPFCDEIPHNSISYENQTKNIYKRLNISEDGKHVLGGVLVGDAEEYNLILQMTLNKIPIKGEPESLIIKGGNSGGDDSAGIEFLPDSALICSCESVTKGDLVHQITEEGVTDLAELKACTKAGTGCGGCVPMVKDILNHTLKSMGKTVNRDICEHFAHDRQSLYHIIKVKGYKTYKEVIEHEGKGHGCEICKPLIGSILASIHNEMVTDQSTIQDTNDRYLANIQKGGTYSVVPRIPGGEITPEKLIVIGEVAKKYNLYTKITGGQRIDMFGAHVGDLPDIWKELIDAGFETGQAYGKSVRTVKSCVGSTWCRFGLQESVSMAIDIENRYKGLRAPHKLKFAVSGCVRECAEAQNKDIGVIATEKGWILFVCGNGGAKPQHGPLFASDIDNETLIKYIDRVLMFYIRTADPLQRTATWFNKLEGGLDYLKDVVINDSLSICEELDKEMQHHVDTYKCEWKDVVENPEKQKLFRHFINSEDKDSNIEFVELRDQKMPQPW